MTAFVNNVKTAVLLALLFGLFVFVGASIGGKGGLIFAAILGVITNFLAWWKSDKLAIRSMRGQEVTTTNAPELYHMVERLAQAAELPMPKVYVCPHDVPNAFATGRSPNHAAVAVTQGCLGLLSPTELEGVIAHELAHIRNRDTLTSTIAATVAGIFSTLAQWAMYFGGGIGGGGRGNDRGGHPFAALAMILLGALGAAVIKAMISRSREFVADADGAEIAGSPDGLASALRTLDRFSQRAPLRGVNPAMANLFIVEPFLGRTLTNLFASHPPTEARIRALLKDAHPGSMRTVEVPRRSRRSPYSPG